MPLQLRYVVLNRAELSEYNDRRTSNEGRYSINFVMQGGVYDCEDDKILCVVDDIEDAWRITQAMNLCA